MINIKEVDIKKQIYECPACSNWESMYVGEINYLQTSIKFYAVFCANCKMRTFPCKTQNEAIDIWNAANVI